MAFFKTSNFLRIFTLPYWGSPVRYDHKWDTWVNENLGTIEPVYWSVKPDIVREKAVVQIGDRLMWIGNDPGHFGILVNWAPDDGNVYLCSGRPSRRTQQLIRNELREINTSLDFYDAQAKLTNDLLPVSG